MKLTCDLHGSFQCHAYIPSSLFSSYSISSELVSLCVHSESFLKGLEIVSKTASIKYNPNDDFLLICSRENDLNVEIHLKTLQHDPVESIAFSNSSLEAKLIISSDVLFSVLKELSPSDHVNFEVSDQDPCLQLFTKNSSGKSKVFLSF